MLKTLLTSEVTLTNIRAMGLSVSSWLATLVMRESSWIERLEVAGKVAQVLTVFIGMASMIFLAIYNYRKMKGVMKRPRSK